MKTREEIGVAIRNSRTEKRLTQQKLGEKCGYEGRNAELMIQHWEKGRAPIPLDKIRILAEAVGLTLDDLIP